MKIILLLILQMLIFISCSNVDNKKPDALLKSFIVNSFDQKINLSDLDTYFSGEILSELKKSSDEKIRELFETRGAKLVSFEVFSRVCEKSVCYLTFSVTYKEEGQVGTSAKKVAKIVEIAPQNWRIEEISHIKTFHNFKSIIEIVR